MAHRKPPVSEALKEQPQTLKPITFHKAIVYSCYGEPSLTLDNTCGDLVDKLMSMCLGEPEFLPPQNRRRYLQLLPNFKNFVFSASYRDHRDILVGNERIAAIRRPMFEWVWSFFKDEHHPILPSYALDVTQFIARMVEGGRRTVWDEEGRPPFEVNPVVKVLEEHQGISLGDEKSFKTDFTRRNPLHCVVCRVPANGAVKRGEEVIFRPGDEFRFYTGRCYLSRGFYDYIHVSCYEEYRPNLQSDFEFFGEIAAGDENKPGSWQTTVPANWVIAAVTSHAGIDGQWVEEHVPVPYCD
jgi:hypothetical protein